MELRAIVVDRDAASRKLAGEVLRFDGWQVSEAKSVDEMSQLLKHEICQLVICHVECYDESGSDALTSLLQIKRKANTDVHIIMTAEQNPSQAAVTAILNGASDFLAKPYTVSELRERSRTVIARLRAIEREVVDVLSKHETTKAHGLCPTEELVGRSSAIVNVLKEIARSVKGNQANSETDKDRRPPTYFISGETGTGKEIVARLIHKHSRYRSGHFVPINCSNLTPELADAELFGSCPGAYTGAPREEQAGLWEMASGGTLFLDEITEAPRAVMPKLLRVLQDGQVRKIGAKRWVKTDVQVVAATNQDILAEVKRERFREDLYQRLGQHHIYLPSLRERLDDVPILASHFAHLHSVGSVRLATDAIQLLTEFACEYTWSGNIRELENIIRRAVAHTPDKTVYAVDLAPHLPARDAACIQPASTDERRGAVEKTDEFSCKEYNHGGLDERVRRFRNNVIKDMLAAHHGNRSHAANSLNVSRSKLHRLLNEIEGECVLRYGDANRD